ncbi:peroxisomal membrane protein PMP22-like isoform X4 [Hordeum vulgare subsp. vulgare]|uniref:peroxisomal membrane protein PMP22-like isoform X4 n=1 Tax=Hordeum vulgare subsp. vulgare TaxID=112509 RepID=UPI001D1A3301|nr:peroxisomal membrane protein PMP22-like isoform X4 [Hordeum vulgare subsp. vulgare]
MAGGIGGVGGGTGGEDSLARRAWRQYLLQLQRHPLRTKMITAGFLAGISDSVAQKLSGYQKIEKRRLLLKMVLLEQITSSPWNNLLFLFYYGYVVEKRPFKEVKIRVKKQYLSVQLSAWMFWPVVGWINHQYVPLQFRVIVHSFVACCWGIFLNLRARAMSLKQS